MSIYYLVLSSILHYFPLLFFEKYIREMSKMGNFDGKENKEKNSKLRMINIGYCLNSTYISLYIY